MKKKTIIFSILIACVLFFLIKSFVYSVPDNIDEICDFCVKNNYNTTYCCLVDFSRHSGENRFYIYDFKKKRVIAQSLCANGLGKTDKLFNLFANRQYFSNEIGSNYSSLGKYKIGKIRKMTNPYMKEGYALYGLDSTNDNAFVRAQLYFSLSSIL